MDASKLASSREYFDKLSHLFLERKENVSKSSYHLKAPTKFEALEIMHASRRVKELDKEIDTLKRENFTLLDGGKSDV